MTPDSPDRAAEVLRLAYAEGLGVRTIARRLSMSRRTVRRMLGKERPKPRPKQEARKSILDPYMPVIRDLLRETPEMKAPAVLERLRPLGYSGGVTILRDQVRKLRPGGQREAFLTLDFAPGRAVQVDWADFGFALPGCPRRVSAFVMALCYSRYLYIEFTLSQSMGTFLRCMERGLAFFGGTTVVDIFDNMKTVVQDPKHQVFNPRFLEYAAARGFAGVACNPGKGNEKGRVERPIGFVRERFWPGRRFGDLLDLNVQATAWRDDFANNRVHEVTGKVPSLVFEHEEKALLKPLRWRSPSTPTRCSPRASPRATASPSTATATPSRRASSASPSSSAARRQGRHLPRAEAGRGPPPLLGRRRGHPATRRHDDGVLEQKPRAAAGGPLRRPRRPRASRRALLQDLRGGQPLHPARGRAPRPPRRALRRERHAPRRWTR